MKQVAVSALNTYTSASIAADDISAGDGAVNITTSSGNITIDTTAGDADIIFKGTDDSADITALTLDMSAAGEAIFNAGITIADAGTIGSASDKDAIAIGSDGDVTLTQDLELQHDGAILSFGANDEISLTHVHDTGLLLNTASVIQFRDSAINIGSPADGDLDINADDEIELNSTLIDINGAVDMSSTLTVAGVLTGASLDISGDIDVDGTSNLDIVDIDGAVDMASTLTVAGVLTGTSLDISGDIDIDGTSNLDIVDIDGAVDMASTLTVAGVLTGASLDISGDIDIDGTSNLDIVDIDGAVDMASTLAVAGVVTANAGVVVDNITIDGTEIDLSSGDFLLDVAGDITFDAGGGDFDYHVAGTEILKIAGDSSNVIIKSTVSDKDITIQGNDGGAAINALAFDMSAAGKATFNDDIVLGTAGKGIYLGVTSATAANLLDDYEEGTWTPTFNRSSSQITIAILRANYTKIGRLVHVTMHAVNNDGAKSNAHIVGDGLPFTSAAINVIGVGGTFAVHPGSGNSNNDVGAAGSWTQDNDWYMVPSHNGSNGYRYLYNWANGAYIEVAFWYYAA
jgi:hypothetical protein